MVDFIDEDHVSACARCKHTSEKIDKLYREMMELGVEANAQSSEMLLATISVLSAILDTLQKGHDVTVKDMMLKNLLADLGWDISVAIVRHNHKEDGNDQESS